MVVLPTYNEIANLEKMVLSLLSSNPSLQVLIVDDNSPDGTGRLADELVLKHPQSVFVSHRQKKEGLGKAYLHGFRAALNLGADYIVQMDCDFSHPVALIPEMLRTLQDYDFVLGSRYISGGGTENWGLIRQMISRSGNIYARLVLGSPLHDLTGGFKAFRRKVVEFLFTCPLDCSGYSFQIETTSFARAAGFSCKEIPFIFKDRVLGESKMSKDIILEAFLKTFKLRSQIKKMKKKINISSLPDSEWSLEQNS